MNSNNQKPLTQNDKSPRFSYFSKEQNNLNLNQTQNIPLSPINNVSILKTEEQKEIVRTDVYGDNGSSPGNKEHFCVVTEVIRRKSNLPFDSNRNSFNKNQVLFSFTQPIQNFSFNQDIRNKNLNQKNSKEEYKILIKRIASQLNTKIKPPTQGFFFFALQKGQYPLMIINKIKTEILNHNIELNSDIFETYYNKYLKYRELVKKIAFLLKKNLNNQMFLKNSMYFQNNQNNNYINRTQNIQLNSRKNNNNTIQEKEIQINKQNNYNILFNKNNDYQNIAQNNFNLNIQKDKINNNKNIQNININYNVDRMNSHNNTNRQNIKFQNSSQPFTASHKLSNVINPFREAKNKNISLINFSKKNDFVIKNNPFIAQNQNLNNSKKEIKEDIEMKDESKKNFNIIEQAYHNMANIQNINNEIFYNQSNNLESTKNIVNNYNNILQNNRNQNIASDIKVDINDQKIITNTNKSKQQNIKIVFSTMKKSKEKTILSNINNIDKKNIDISLNSIIIPKNMTNITNEHTSFVNNFNTFMSNNSIYLEYNVPSSKEEKGQAILIRDEFWQKYISFIFINYLINKENKLSLFSFVYLIEQYFTWCENNDSKSMTLFKEKIIECINKMHEKNNINKFLEMHRLKTLDELFNKYDFYIKKGNNKQKEIEIKIDSNNSECNCDVCIKEKACLKKMIELNKKLSTRVNAENLIINAEYSKKNKNIKNENNINYEYDSNNNQISIGDEEEVFSDSKVIHTFEITYQFIPSKDYSPKKKNKLIKSNYKSLKKERSAKKSISDESQSSTAKKREKEILFDLSNNRKIEEYFKPVKSLERSVSEGKNKKLSSIKKSSNKKRSNTKSIRNRKSSKKKKSTEKRSNKKSTNKKYPKIILDDENIEIKEEKIEEEKKCADKIEEEKKDEEKIEEEKNKNKEEIPKKKYKYPKDGFSSDSENEKGKRKVTNISRKYKKKKGKKF